MLKRSLVGATLLAATLSGQSLNESLEERKTNFLKQAPAGVAASQNRALHELETSGIYDQVLKVGDKAPDFTLKNHDGREVCLSEQLKDGPVVLT